MQHKGFTIEISHDGRGQWRVRLRTANGGKIRIADDPQGIEAWVSAPYMDRNFAIEQAKALIDAGGVS